MDPIREFYTKRNERMEVIAESESLKKSSQDFLRESMLLKYPYNFQWLGCPIIQYPQDIVAMQETVWSTKPDLIIETGIAHGGSLIFYASMMQLIGGDGDVLGIDIDIREHNRKEIERHPMFKRITMIEGSSTDENIMELVREHAKDKKCVMVVLDSMHTHDHVLKELEIYSPLVSFGSYIVVCDTVVEELPENSFPGRPWGKGNNPKTAIDAFLKTNKKFMVDNYIDKKLLITVSRGGYLRRTK